MVNRQVHIHSTDLTIAPGSFNVIVGRTRAGKTSLLRLIAGLDSPSTGTISLAGQDLGRLPLRRRPVAMVYQEFINYPSLTVYENIASPLRRQKAPRIDERVRELAETLHLSDFLKRLPGHLSGGQKQRVAIARALAKGAELLLLDEPLVNLDYKLREELRDELRGILVDGKQTVLYATSEPGEAMAFGGHTIVLHEGRVAQSAPALEVYHRPASLRAARVFSDPPMNFFSARITGGTARILSDGDPTGDPDGEGEPVVASHLAALPDGQYRLAIRASDCTLKAPDRRHVELPGTVELVEISGSETFVHLRTRFARFIVREEGVCRHPLGQETTLFIDPARLLAFDEDSETLAASYRSPAIP